MEANFPKLEEQILERWRELKAFAKSWERRPASRRTPPFVFYEGPPTANGSPGIHHVLSRVFKDVVCRYKTMRGFFVPRKAGGDTKKSGIPLRNASAFGWTPSIPTSLMKESIWRACGGL